MKYDSLNNYYHVLRSLVPKGLFWHGKNFLAFIECISISFNDARDYIDSNLLECFPSGASLKYIEEWEKIYKIEHDYSKSLQERESLVLARMCFIGGNTIDYIMSVARSFDKKVTIIEKQPTDFRAGRARAGERLGIADIPKFHIVFAFTDKRQLIREKIIEEMEKICPAHVKFIYYFNGELQNEKN